MLGVIPLRWVGPLGGVATSLALSCVPSPFTCTGTEQCTRAVGGRCEVGGGCSYPDPDCESGRRYSRLGPVGAGQCTEPEDGTSGGAASSSGGDRDTIAGDGSTSGAAGTTEGDESTGANGLCADVGCSGNGTCVVVDDLPTCACDPGWTMVGQECLEDPCETKRCFFVADGDGDDMADGSRENPWRTPARVEDALVDALPGDHFLFRRGDTFSGGSRMRIVNVEGERDDPIVIGAYGPVDQPRPRLRPLSFELASASDIVIRDLDVQGEAGPCFNLERTDFITLHDNETVGCEVRTFRVWNEAAHTTIFRNTFRDGGNKSAVFISNTNWEPFTYVGSHHWVADNVIANNGERGIDIVVSSDEVGDVKVVGNQIADIGGVGIRLDAQYAWVLGNTLVNAGRDIDNTRAGMDLDGRAHFVAGNVVAGGDEAIDMSVAGELSGNTLLQTGGVALRLSQGSGDVRAFDNLVFADGGTNLNVVGGNPTAWLAELDRMAYAATMSGACAFTNNGMTLDLAQWQMAWGLDQSSSCEVVAGLADVSAGPQPPFDDAVWQAVTPAAGSGACETAGAFDCDGVRRATAFAAHPEFPQDGGKGWPGPLLIQQHYPVD